MLNFTTQKVFTLVDWDFLYDFARETAAGGVKKEKKILKN